MPDSEMKHCGNCLFIGTHEECTGCLGSPVEVKEREDQGFTGYSAFLYKHWQPGDGMARLRQFERDGKRSIVIGWVGEAEVNVKDSPEDTLKRLCGVAEECGYLVSKGKWTEAEKHINVLTHAHYVLKYTPRGLHSIIRRTDIVIWDAEGG